MQIALFYLYILFLACIASFIYYFYSEGEYCTPQPVSKQVYRTRLIYSIRNRDRSNSAAYRKKKYTLR